MAKAPYYTEEQDRALLNLHEDMKAIDPNVKYTDVADNAIRYNIAGCGNRSRDGLAQRISFLTTPPKEKTKKETEEEQMEFDVETEMLRAELKDCKRRLEGLLDAVIGEAGLYVSKGRAGLSLNYTAIISYLWRNETERVNAKLEALQTEDEDKGEK